MPGVDAVTFDYWGTLVWDDRGALTERRIEAWRSALDAAGIRVTAEELRTATQAAWSSYVRHWEANRQYRASDALADIVASLGVEPRDGARAAMLEAFGAASRGADLRLTAGIEHCLRGLRARGVAIGIVCDVGMTPSTALLEVLDERGLLRYFDHWSFSDVVGWYKPAREIFEHALAGLGSPDPSRVAHVGDRLRTDVAGARGMGMVSVRYTGVYADDTPGIPDADHVISSHAALAAALHQT